MRNDPGVGGNGPWGLVARPVVSTVSTPGVRRRPAQTLVQPLCEVEGRLSVGRRRAGTGGPFTLRSPRPVVPVSPGSLPSVGSGQAASVAPPTAVTTVRCPPRSLLRVQKVPPESPRGPQEGPVCGGEARTTAVGGRTTRPVTPL